MVKDSKKVLITAKIWQEKNETQGFFNVLSKLKYIQYSLCHDYANLYCNKISTVPTYPTLDLFVFKNISIELSLSCTFIILYRCKRPVYCPTDFLGTHLLNKVKPRAAPYVERTTSMPEIHSLRRLNHQFFTCTYMNKFRTVCCVLVDI